MPELNLKQITDKLNDKFSGEGRRLVFWYDDKAEFAEDIDTLELANAKLYRLEKDNQFYTKYFLERQDRTTNYLIYAPFKKPEIRENHLEDMLLYSTRFFADRASLLALDLRIEEKYKPIIEKHIKFFAAKDRTQRFYDLEIENFTEASIVVALMSALCKNRTALFDEVVRAVLMDGGIEDNKILEEFEKYDLLDSFWRLCEENFGYADVKPTLEKLAVTMFVTYTARCLHGKLPEAWQSFVSLKTGNILAFLDGLMNSVLYREKYDKLSAYMAKGLKAETVFAVYDPATLIDCDAFAVVDEALIDWIKGRLLSEDMVAMLADRSLLEICHLRCQKHFAAKWQMQYKILASACQLLIAANYQCPDGFKNVVEQYLAADFKLDREYRKFYYYYDRLGESTAMEDLRDLVENIYTNEYLATGIAKWNAGFLQESSLSALPLQRNFYSQYIRLAKERSVVILSDALRYEVGQELFLQLQADEKCTAKLQAMLSVLPSYTRLGMAALLPHKKIEMNSDYKVSIDDMPCDDLKQREAVLQRHSPGSRCVQFDALQAMKRAELRELFAGTEVVYIYHNQIDARGDKPNTENEVFTACEEAIQEIHALIKRLTESVSATHFIITADHGFIYKRDKLQEGDKIASATGKGDLINRRFIIGAAPIADDGIASLPLGRVLGNEDDRFVSFPISSNVFKVTGGGQNYVHGGSSAQEMIVPVIDVRTERGHVETRPAQIVLVSMVQKITNLIVSLDFMQSEPVSDVIKAASYKLFFVSEDNEKISNECIYAADKKDSDPQKRIFRLRFNFKDKAYDKAKRYYLVAYDEKNDMEVLRHDVVMDIAFANDFGF